MNLQKTQQEKWRRTPENALQQRAFEHCEEEVPEEADLFELGQSNREIVVVLYLTCEDCGKKGHYVMENRGQGVIKEKEWEELKKYGECLRKGGEGGMPTGKKAQQSSAWARDLKGIAREGGTQREVQRTFKMLKEVWLDIGIERTNTHKGITIKVLLDSGTTGMFIDRKIAAKHGFRLQKLERPVRVKNVDGMYNSGEAIMYEVEVNVYYKSHVERMRMDVCNLGTEVILGMPWLAAHNPEINWKMGEIKMTRCLPLCGEVKIKKKKKKGRRVITLEEEKIIRWIIDDKENWEKEEEIEEDHRKIEEIVPEKFLK